MLVGRDWTLAVLRVTALLWIPVAHAQLSLNLNFQAPPRQCEKSVLEWTGGVPTYNVQIRVAEANPATGAIVLLGDPVARKRHLFSNATRWDTDVPAGTVLVAIVIDSEGKTGRSSLTTVLDSGDQSCLFAGVPSSIPSPENDNNGPMTSMQGVPEMLPIPPPLSSLAPSLTNSGSTTIPVTGSPVPTFSTSPNHMATLRTVLLSVFLSLFVFMILAVLWKVRRRRRYLSEKSASRRQSPTYGSPTLRGFVLSGAASVKPKNGLTSFLTSRTTWKSQTSVKMSQTAFEPSYHERWSVASRPLFYDDINRTNSDPISDGMIASRRYTPQEDPSNGIMPNPQFMNEGNPVLPYVSLTNLNNVSPHANAVNVRAHTRPLDPENHSPFMDTQFLNDDENPQDFIQPSHSKPERSGPNPAKSRTSTPISNIMGKRSFNALRAYIDGTLGPEDVARTDPSRTSSRLSGSDEIPLFLLPTSEGEGDSPAISHFHYIEPTRLPASPLTAGEVETTASPTRPVHRFAPIDNRFPSSIPRPSADIATPSPPRTASSGKSRGRPTNAGTSAPAPPTTPLRYLAPMRSALTLNPLSPPPPRRRRGYAETTRQSSQ